MHSDSYKNVINHETARIKKNKNFFLHRSLSLGQPVLYNIIYKKEILQKVDNINTIICILIFHDEGYEVFLVFLQQD